MRNPYRIAFHPDTDKLYVGDVGWYQWEEINSGGGGANFGWPFYEGGPNGNLPTIQYKDTDEAIAYYATNPDITAPLAALSHLDDGIDAIILGDVYSGNKYPQSLQGDLFFNYFGTGEIKHVSFDANGEVEKIDDFFDGPGFYIQMTIGPDGYLYYLDMATREIGRFVVT